MRVLLINPEFPDTYWSFRHALPFEGKRSAFPPLGLLTVSALLPSAWERRLIDLNVQSLKTSDIDWAAMVFATAMLVQKDSLKKVVARCKARGKRVVLGGPYVTTSIEELPDVSEAGFAASAAWLRESIGLLDREFGAAGALPVEADATTAGTDRPRLDFSVLRTALEGRLVEIAEEERWRTDPDLYHSLAWTAAEAGKDVISEHDEVGPRARRHEELYLVVKGRATFTVDGESVDAPAGTFVFVHDPAAKRKAVAEESETTIVVAGGAPGEVYTPPHWERSAPALVYFANQGSIEFHVWPSRAEAPEHPDLLVFDLDPPEGKFDLVRRTALALRALFEELRALRPAPPSPAPARDAGRGEARVAGSTLGEAVRMAVFWVLAAAFVVDNFTTNAVTVHLIPYLADHGYSPALATGCCAAGGTLGAIVPPGSGPLIVFALLTEASIGRLFVASVGLILAWKVAGYFGADYFLLRWLGTPWSGQELANETSPGSQVYQKEKGLAGTD